MAARKRAPARVPDAAAEAMWVKLPLPPDTAAAVRKHVDAIAGLVDSARGLFELAGQCADVARELEHDAKRAMDVRRRRRRR